MSEPMGRVSAKLEAELRAQVVRRGLVIWLDPSDTFSDFVDALRARRAADELPYKVLAYRGSHLELMMALEGAASGIEPPSLVIHMPGFNEESIRETPVLELYRAGMRFRKGLATLVSEAAAGIAEPAMIEELQREPGLTLEHANRWLTGIAAASEAGLRGELRILPLRGLVDDLLRGGPIARRLADDGTEQALWEHLKATSGIDEAWRALMIASATGAEDFAFAAASWALAVEYVDDLQREPRDPHLGGVRRLPSAVVDACRDLAAHLRKTHSHLYERTARETEEALAEEVKHAKAEDLGKIDTFEFEERRFFAAARAALAKGRWEEARGFASGRLSGTSFWLDRPTSPRRAAWEVILLASHLGLAINAAGPELAAESLARAVERYQQRGAAVDEAHRALEQRWLQVNDGRLPEREPLRAAVAEVRTCWHAWADAWARDFSQLCRAQGFLPAPALRQRTLFEDVVVPLTTSGGGGQTVIFLVDALRYEMAEALRREIGEPAATSIELGARLAELPTITAVGMNALAPVADRGRLRPVIRDAKIQGLAQGEYQVLVPEHRRRAMHDRVGGTDCPLYTLPEILARDAESLRHGISRAKLVVVHVDAIDSAGEKGNGLRVFDQVLQSLRAAWNLLREAGARRFVFTSDHGFLLLDDTVRATQRHGSKIVPSRRHALGTLPEDNRDEVRVPLAQLEYEDPQDLHLMMPEGTAVFDVGKRSLSFVHGGGSLQERVIPVLTIVHRGSGGGDSLTYAIQAHRGLPFDDFHCVRGQIQVVAQHGLNFGGKKEIELGLRALGEPDVQVELRQVRGGASRRGDAIFARVDEDFEVFFKLIGAREARVQLQLYHPTAAADVQPTAIEDRFLVGVRRVEVAPPQPEQAAPKAPSGPKTTTPPSGTTPTSTSASTQSSGREWLALFTDDGVRAVFEHLAVHGVITEAEVTRMLGSGRAFRKFSRQFEELARKAPFVARIANVGGVKRYTRE